MFLSASKQPSNQSFNIHHRADDYLQSQPQHQRAERPDDRLEQCLINITQQIMNDHELNLFGNDQQSILNRIRDICHDIFQNSRESTIQKLLREKQLLEMENQDLMDGMRRFSGSKSRLYSPEQTQVTQSILTSGIRGRLFETDQKDTLRMKRIVIDLEEQVKLINNQLEKMRDQLKMSESALQNSQREIIHLQEEAVVFEMDLRASNQERLEFKTKNELLLNGQRNYELTIREWEKQNDQANNQNKEMEKSLKLTNDLNKQLEEELKIQMIETDRQKKKREQESSKYKQALLELKQKSNERTEKLKQKNKEFNNKIQFDNDEIEDKNEQIKELEKHIQEISEQYKVEIKGLNQQHRKEYEQLESKSLMERQLIEEQIKKQSQAIADDRKQSLNENENIQQRQAERINQLELQLSSNIRSIKQMTLNQSDLEHQVSQKERQLEFLNHQNQAQQQQILQKDHQLQDNQEELIQVKNENSAIQYKLEQLNSDNKQLLNENSQLLSINDEIGLREKQQSEVLNRLRGVLKIEGRGSFKFELDGQVRILVEDKELLQQRLRQIENEHSITVQQLNHFMKRYQKIFKIMQREEELMLLNKKYGDNKNNLDKDIEYKMKEHKLEILKISDINQQFQDENKKISGQLQETLNQLRHLMEINTNGEDRIHQQNYELECFRKEFEAVQKEFEHHKENEDESKKRIQTLAAQNGQLKNINKSLLQKQGSIKQKLRKMILKIKDNNDTQIKELKQLFTSKIRLMEGEFRILIQSQFKKIMHIMEQKQRICESEKQAMISQLNVQIEKDIEALKQQNMVQERQIINDSEKQQKALQEKLEIQMMYRQEKVVENAQYEQELLRDELQKQIQELDDKQGQIERLENLLAQQTRSHEREMQKYISQLSELGREMYKYESLYNNSEQHRRNDREGTKTLSRNYESNITQLQRKMEEQTSELKEQYEQRIFQLKQTLVENYVSPDKIPKQQTRTQDKNYESPKDNHYITYTPNPKTYINSHKSSQKINPSSLLNQSSKINEENTAERSIEELRQEIVNQKNKLNQIKLNFSESSRRDSELNINENNRRDASESRKVSFAQQISSPVQDRQNQNKQIPTRFRRELSSTFNEMNI